MKRLHFPDIDAMPDFPALPCPDLAALNSAFRAALMNPDNHILRYSSDGHPIFGAYVNSTGNEMVTWGILAVGEWLSNRDPAWIASTYSDFFVEPLGLYMNSPGSMRTEHWYLFYVNTLAGAVMRTLFPKDEKVRARFSRSADAMARLAARLQDDFNQQGYSFDLDAPFTHKDIYRQPDSIAGYAYNMLFAALWADRPQYFENSVRALEKYQSFEENPWYEIPNGSAGLMAAAYLNAHGFPLQVEKMAHWVFDHDHGPLQCGKWGGEEIDGLMMGWRGDTREDAMRSAYSMETLMPLQFLLPTVRYMPEMGDAVAKYVRCVLANFRLFYALGTRPLYETRPELDPSIPYERLDACRDGHAPAACGDFHGHRSVYGAGYLYWAEALSRKTTDDNLLALDLSLTDWLARERFPVFLLRNPYGQEKQVSFTPAPVWRKLQPALFAERKLHADVFSLPDGARLEEAKETVRLTVPPRETCLIALLPRGAHVTEKDGFATGGGAELCRLK